MTSPTKTNWPRFFTATRITRPRLPKILARQECLNALNEATDHKIVYISGRAGQGKTTLALSWLKETKKKSVWITLEEGDNDPVVFFSLLAEAFSIAFPRIELDLPSIPSGAPFELTVFARSYLHKLLAHVQGRYAIVLDDMHTLDENGSLPGIVEALIEALPAKSQLVFLSRRLPSSFLTKWIAARQLFPITEEKLRFSVKEVKSLFSTVFAMEITSLQAESLQTTMEGWVTGLILMHERSRNRPEGIGPNLFLQKDIGDSIFDYLYQQVYRGLSPALQNAMMRLALFDSFSVESARRLISGGDVAAQIRFLLGHHLLCETPAEDQIRFRYHPLLRQFLQTQVRELPAGERHALVEQVGATQELEGAIDRAIDLYLQFDHYDHAIRLIEKIGLTYTLEGRRHTLRQWIRSIPQTQLEHHPWLQYFLASGQAFSDPAEALASYRQAIAGFERNGDIEGELWARSSRMMLSLYAGCDFRPIQADAKWGKENLLRCIGSPLARASFLLAEAFTGLAATDQPQHALRKALAAAEIGREAQASTLSARALIRAGFSACYLGKHRLALSLFDQSEAILPWNLLDPPLRAEAHIYRGMVATYCGNKVASRADLLEAQRICLEFGLKSQLPYVQSFLIWNRVTLGEGGEGDPSLKPVRTQMLAAGNFFYAATIAHAQALLCFEAGDLLQALKYEEESLHLAKRCHTRFLLLIPLAILGAIWGELKEFKKAQRYLQRALKGFERAGSDMFCFMALLHLAKLALDQGNEDETKKYLTQALHYGKHEEYLVGEGIRPKIMGRLINRARQWGIEPNYVNKLIDFWQVRPEPPLKIRTFGAFEVTLDGKPIQKRDWHGRKVQLFLIALLSMNGGEARKEEIMDLLWPDADGDKAVINFHVTLHRLQAVFGCSGKDGGFLNLSQSRLSLNPTYCWVDSCAFEEAIRQARRAESAGRWGEAQRFLQEAHSLYQGDYLPEFGEEPWIENKRKKLLAQFDSVRQRLKNTAA